MSISLGFFAESAHIGSLVSRANSIGSTSASSVPNTGDNTNLNHLILNMAIIL